MKADRTIDVRNQKVPWTVDDYGVFHCVIGDETIGAASLADLTVKARTIAQQHKVHVDIPVTILGYGKDATNVTLTGRNARTRGVTYRDDVTKKAGEMESFSDCYRQFTASELSDYAGLAQAFDDAETARDAFLNKRKLSKRAGTIVDDAIAKALVTVEKK